MRASLLILVVASCVLGCGEKYNVAELACQDAFDAEQACREEAGMSALTVSKEQQCAAKLSGTGDDEASLDVAAADYDCELAAWQDGDCSTEGGVSDADQVATDCHS